MTLARGDVRRNLNARQLLSSAMARHYCHPAVMRLQGTPWTATCQRGNLPMALKEHAIVRCVRSGTSRGESHLTFWLECCYVTIPSHTRTTFARLIGVAEAGAQRKSSPAAAQ